MAKLGREACNVRVEHGVAAAYASHCQKPRSGAQLAPLPGGPGNPAISRTGGPVIVVGCAAQHPTIQSARYGVQGVRCRPCRIGGASRIVQGAVADVLCRRGGLVGSVPIDRILFRDGEASFLLHWRDPPRPPTRAGCTRSCPSASSSPSTTPRNPSARTSAFGRARSASSARNSCPPASPHGGRGYGRRGGRIAVLSDDDRKSIRSLARAPVQIPAELTHKVRLDHRHISSGHGLSRPRATRSTALPERREISKITCQACRYHTNLDLRDSLPGSPRRAMLWVRRADMCQANRHQDDGHRLGPVG
jgi:hypothetical protein